MTAVMIPAIPSFKKSTSDALNMHGSYPFEVLDQDHCEVDVKHEEKTSKEIFSTPSFCFTRRAYDRNVLLRGKCRRFIFSFTD